jgi:hypothetical protein
MSNSTKITRIIDLFLFVAGVVFLRSKFEIKVKVFDRECTIQIISREKNKTRINLDQNNTEIEETEKTKKNSKRIK